MNWRFIPYWVLGLVALCNVSRGQVYEDFNELSDGTIHKQSFWRVGSAELAQSAFTVMDELGVTQKPGDKALIISGVEANVKATCKNPVSWKKGSTVVFEMDFQIGLSDKHVDEILNGVVIQLGDPNLQKTTRWAIGVGTGPDGRWYIRGNAPAWENLKPMPAKTFLARPQPGESAVSKWFHLKLSSEKSTTPNVFKTNLTILNPDGDLIVNHDFKDDPVTGEMSALWHLDSVGAGLAVKQTINGLVCVDNLSLTSTSVPKKAKGLEALLLQ